MERPNFKPLMILSKIKKENQPRNEIGKKKPKNKKPKRNLNQKKGPPYKFCVHYTCVCFGR
jgi:hypothetical protein